MLRYLYGRDLEHFPDVQAGMFTDRAAQFHHRLKWDVAVDDRGWEVDAYDTAETLYVIWTLPDGRHGGSMRFLPLDGPTMVNDHFQHLLGGKALRDPRVWECTRFCLADGVPGHVAGALMLAGGELMRHFRLTHLLGVFDARMIRIYRMIGASPMVLGSAGKGREQISVGLWGYSLADRAKVLLRAGVSPDASEYWFRRSFGVPIMPPRAA